MSDKAYVGCACGRLYVSFRGRVMAMEGDIDRETGRAWNKETLNAYAAWLNLAPSLTPGSIGAVPSNGRMTYEYSLASITGMEVSGIINHIWPRKESK